MNVKAFGFFSSETATMNIKSQGSFLINQGIILQNFKITLENSVQISAFLHLRENATIFIEVKTEINYFIYKYIFDFLEC